MTTRHLSRLTRAASIVVVAIATTLAVPSSAPAPAPTPALTSVSATDSPPAPRATSAPRDERGAKSLVIGVDGVTYDELSRARTPHIAALQRAGTTAPSALFAEPMAPTLSGPGWASILTGTWPDRHRVVDNEFTGNRLDRFPDYLTRLERAQPRLDVGAVTTWEPIVTGLVGSRVTARASGDSDADTTRQAARALRRPATDSLFVQLDEVDLAGHEHGAASPEYAQALSAADRRIGTLLRAVRDRPQVGRERWLVVVTTDHGHTDAGGHGGDSPGERGTFIIARGSGFAAGAVRHDLRVVDIAPTVLAHHGVVRRAAWRLDGLAAREVVADAFDRLRPRLRAQVDETGAAAVRGWTTTAPRGWRVDNRRMPDGGTTEWRGWSFATDDFWTAADRGQGRETNVRSRDVFAVADSDEWDDVPHAAGAFDSTLVTPAYDVAGRRRAVLTYATTYAVDGPQSARVLASIDGRAPVLAKSYSSPANTRERLALRLPRGARTVRFRFHYVGVNSAFWTVDQVRVRAR